MIGFVLNEDISYSITYFEINNVLHDDIGKL